MTEAGGSRVKSKVNAPAPVLIEHSMGLGLTSKRNSTQHTQRKKISNQLNNFLQGDNFINYK